MTERDVIHYVVTHGYISQQVADAVAGARDSHFAVPKHAAQEGLLASRPTLASAPAPATCLEIGSLRHGSTPAPQSSYEWKGKMSDLYNLDASYVELESFTNNTNAWTVSDMYDPSGSDKCFAGEV